MTGIVSRQSTHDVPETAAAIRAAIEAKGAVVSAVVDHAAAAQAVGLDMPPLKRSFSAIRARVPD